MNDLEKILSKANSISNCIKILLKQSTYTEYDDMSGLEINYNDADQLFLLDELRGVMEKLDSAKDKIDYINKPIKLEGYLYKNSNGRYQVEYKEYTSGNLIEILIEDDYHDVPFWQRTRVEHDGKDYYVVGCEDVKMQGLKVRVRG